MIKCVAIDDEPIALSIIEEYCRRYGDIDLLTFSSPVSGIECIRQTRPDIVFLDVEMKSHNGIDIARDLPESTCVIFTTAFSQYALDGFDVDAVDFLHKPIFYPRFERAMEKARRMLQPPSRPDEPDAPHSFSLKVEHKNVVLQFADIDFVEAMENYVRILRRNLPPVLSQITMKEMEELLPADRFVRVHRSYIVALRAVDRYSNKKIYIRDSDKIIPVGRTYNSVLNKL